MKKKLGRRAGGAQSGSQILKNCFYRTSLEADLR